MSRMGAEGYSSAGSTQLSAKVPEPLKSDFRDACEQRGESMTDVIEEKMQEVVEEESGEITTDGLPDDERLRSAYQRLRSLCDPDTHRIDTDTAESAVAEASKVKISSVRRAVLDPLKRRGLLQYRWGVIQVTPPEGINNK